MGKTSLECDKPFAHPGKGVSVKYISNEFRETAKKLFPNTYWYLMRKLCVSCRTKVTKALGKSKDDDERGSNADEPESTVPSLAPLAAPPLAIQLSGSTHIQLQPATPSCIDNSPRNEPFSQEQDLEQVNSQGNLSQDSAVSVANTDVELHSLNLFLENTRISPITKSTRHKPASLRRKAHQLDVAVEAKFARLARNKFAVTVDSKNNCEFCETLLLALANKFRDCNSKNDKYKLLTVCPGRYDAKRISDAFGCSYHMALAAQALRIEHGVFSSPPIKAASNIISEEVKALVRQFYFEHARPSPNMRDTVRVRHPNGNYEIVGKHFLLNNLTDLYALFKNENEHVKIGRSKFALEKPKGCKWPNFKGEHTSCLCEIHENFKFLYNAFLPMYSLRVFVENVLCNPIRPACAFGFCLECPKQDVIERFLNNREDDDEIRYQKWIRTDCTEFQTIVCLAEQAKELFPVNLAKFLEHDFINQKQKMFLDSLKTNAIRDENAMLIQVDFAMNYNFIIQDSVQSFHWSALQCTIHPFAVHWWNYDENVVRSKHYVVISDELSHDSDTFNSFKRRVITLIKNQFPENFPRHIFYFSDGCAAHYKCKKNFSNLMEHFNDFGISASWYFGATSHSKSTCDSIGAVVKRTARVHSLTRGQITTANELFNFCVEKLTSEKLEFIYVSKDTVAAERILFGECYQKYRSIPATRKYHSFEPFDEHKISLRKFSGSLQIDTFDFQRNYAALVPQEDLHIGDFYAFVEDNDIQVGMLVDLNEIEAEFQSMLIARGNFNLRWPAVPINQRTATTEILIRLPEPIQVPGNRRIYKYTNEQIRDIKQRFELYRARRR